MGFLDAFNVKKKLAAMEGGEYDGHVDVTEREAPKQFTIFERSAMDISRLVQPEAASERETYFKVGDEYCRTLFIHTFPPSVEDNWMRGILRFQHAIDIALYIQPLPVKAFLHSQRGAVARDDAAIRKEQEDGLIVNHKRLARLRDNTELIAAIEEDATKPFQVMLIMTIRARSLKELDAITHSLEASLKASATTRQARHRHKKGFDTTLPLMCNELKDMQVVHTLHTQGIMATFPFSASDITHESGVLVGVSQQSNSPIVLNRFMQPQIESANTVVFGASGSGKSFFCKLEMLRWAYQGVPIMVLDPSGEYRRVCEGLGGENVNISLDSGQCINPLDFSHAVAPGRNALREKITYAVELMRVMFRNDDQGGLVFDPLTKKVIELALHETYRGYGYTVSDVAGQSKATPERMPTLGEVHFMLHRVARTDRDPETQRRIQPLLAAMERYVGDGSLAPLFDNRTTVDTRSHFINFNYSGLSDEYLPMAMHLVLEFIRTSLFTEAQQSSGQNRLVYVDEAQVLMAFPETAHFLSHMFRQCRKFGIGTTVMTQNVGVFVAEGGLNKVGAAILANSPIKVLLKQEPSEAEAVQAAFHLTESELSKLLGSGSGEGLVLVGRENSWFTAVGLASPEEYAMLTTTMTERAQLADAERLSLPPAEEDYSDRFFTPAELPMRDEAHQLPPGRLPELPAAASPFDEDPFAFDDDDDDRGGVAALPPAS